jgi:hypothetical protein
MGRTDRQRGCDLQRSEGLLPIVHYPAARSPVARRVPLMQFYHGARRRSTRCGGPDLVKQRVLWKKAQEKLFKEVYGIQIYQQQQVCPRKDNLDLAYELKGSLNVPPPIIQKTHFKKPSMRAGRAASCHDRPAFGPCADHPPCDADAGVLPGAHRARRSGAG